MNIAILGAGNVGATLGKRFAEQGHTVSFGVPNPQKYADSGLPGTVSAVAEAAQTAEILLLAVPYNAVEQVIKECGDLRGKTLIDATNPLGMTNKGLGLTTGFSTSGAEKIAALAPAARLVKCFNQTGFGNMAEPRQSVMFVCGDDASANETVRRLAAEIGFDAIAIGTLDKARLLEPLAMLWIHLSMATPLQRDFAFGLLRR
jgi:predicted dinucleotide-binding enzyme